MEVHCQLDLVYYYRQDSFLNKKLCVMRTHYAYLDALVMMVTDESLCWCFHSLAASCASWQRRPPRWVSSPGLRPRDPRPAAERSRASARCPSSLRPLSRSAAAAATSAYTLTKLLRKSESEDVSICLHYGQSNDLIENATGLRGCGGEKLTRHHYILFLFRLCLYFTIILQYIQQFAPKIL